MTERTRVNPQTRTRPSPQMRSSPRSRSGRRVWTWLGVVTAVLLSIGAVAALRGPSSNTPLDPDSATPQGSMALAELLLDHGVSVQKVRTFSEATTTNPAQTLLIVNSPLIREAAGIALAEIATKRTVVVGSEGGAATLVKSREDSEPAELAADCRLPEARAAGSASFSDQLISGTGQRCFPGTSGAGLLVKDSLFVLADGSSMTNQKLADAGNAALGLNLLSATDEVIWFIPSPTDIELAGDTTAGPGDLLPSWIAPVLVQTLLAFLVLALWQGQRLGPLIRAPLPIVVPAHETDEGYASLLQRNGQPGVAAAALRETSRARLASLCGLPPLPRQDVLAGALAARLDQSEPSIADMLWQRRITTDTELAQLHQDLGRLEEQCRLTNRPTE